MKFNLRDVWMYLEDKMHFDLECDEEYGVYLDLRYRGYEAFRDPKNKKIVKSIFKDMMDEYNGDRY